MQNAKSRVVDVAMSAQRTWQGGQITLCLPQIRGTQQLTYWMSATIFLSHKIAVCISHQVLSCKLEISISCLLTLTCPLADMSMLATRDFASCAGDFQRTASMQDVKSRVDVGLEKTKHYKNNLAEDLCAHRDLCELCVE